MENELSIKISASAEKALQSLDKLIPKINQTDNCVSKMLMNFDKNGQLTGFTTELSKLDSEMNKVTKSSKNMKNALNLGILFAGARQIFRTGFNWMSESTNYSEALNLFNVVLDESIDKGMKFQNVMNEAFGTNMTETLTRQGLFQSMAENMGIAQEYAYIMSETSTKLVNDISSLYNKNENTVAEALRAGIYAGQTKPLRSFGMDITEKSLQPILDELDLKNSDGTDRTVRQLSQAEKQILRYIAVLEQSKEAQGDWANTIESPANQLKILSNQAIEASKSLGNLFIGSFAKILPYANAILMVIEEVANAIALMFGIEISDYNTGVADMSDAFSDVEDSVGSASDAVKELKRQTLGFDQINNITENKNNGSGSGSALNGGIDQKLLDAITSYDNGMESVRMKAIEIRDNIMEWLGFTKEIDPLTGKVSFKYGGIDKTLKNMWKSFKGLSNTGKILVGLGLVAGITKLYNKGKQLLTILNGTGLVKQVKNLVSPLKTLPKYIDDINFSNTKLTQGLGQQITKWGQSLTGIEKFKLGVVGLSGLAITFDTMSKTMDDMSRNGVDLGNSLGALTSGLSSVASGAMLGTSILPGWGTAIGACAGGVLSLISALKGYKSSEDLALESAKEKLEVSKEYLKSLKDQIDIIDEQMNADLSIHTNNEKILTELQNLVDANGKVKDGYEDRVNFILTELNDAYGTEYTLVDGQIQKYDELVGNIETVISKKKAEIILEANKEKYTLAIQNEKEAYEDLSNAQDTFTKSSEKLKELETQLLLKQNELNDAKTRHEELSKKGINRTREEQNEMFQLSAKINILTNGIEELNRKKEKQQEIVNENNATLKTYEQTVDTYTKNIMDYENLLTATTKGNAEDINEAIDSITKTHNESAEEILRTNLNKALSILRTSRETNGTILEEDRKTAQSLIDTAVNTLAEQSKTIEDLSPDVISAWKTLGESSNEDFQNALKKVDPSVRTSILAQVGRIGTEAGKKLGSSLSEAFSFVSNGMKVTTYADGTVKVTTKADGGIFSNGKWQNIAKYASGGLPPTGQMFIAREKGPELVGSIGSKTAVMNNNQIVESVKAGVYEAVASAMSQVSLGGQDIRVYAEEGLIVEKAVRGIQNHVVKTGELPFTVPV